MKNIRRPLLWIVALAVPASLLVILPSGAADPAAETATAPPPEPVTSDELPPDERVSADNNLSFPVDI